MNEYRDGTRAILKESYWTVWKVVPLLILLIVILFTINSFMKVGGKAVERQVLINSHQYKEGMEQRAGVLNANIAEVDAMIATGQGDKDALLAQKRVLKAQLNAITK